MLQICWGQLEEMTILNIVVGTCLSRNEVSSLLRKSNVRKGVNTSNIEMGDSQIKQVAP